MKKNDKSTDDNITRVGAIMIGSIVLCDGNITRVGAIMIGSIVLCDGIIAKVIGFKNKSTVILKNTKYKEDEWKTAERFINSVVKFSSMSVVDERVEP